MSIQRIPDEVIESEILKIRNFFSEVPYKRWKKVLWELYSCYVYQTEEVNSGKENSEMLLLYEDLRRFLKDMNRLNEKMKTNDKKCL
ncbi:hypothetical protein [Filimonas effusa]|uniref:Uncharacterized protein n=1 Tax=Filimonas effusa TaxID=2508721 RepID=A0A4Q1D6G5_9BACT|nr:hypothetical protein [Filimonas effusa]RXK83473.1 hypothetical protein ESB13_15375 [Filimonas effusa]